ncbi:MAG: hypothetical protein ACRD1K_15545 [Acidimicrobiales bacterium]
MAKHTKRGGRTTPKPHPVLRDTTELVGGTLELTAAGHWWLEAAFG